MFVKKMWYSRNFGSFRCAWSSFIDSCVGRAMTTAFMWPTLSCSASSDSTRYTSLARISFIEYTIDTAALASRSSSRHFMPEISLALSRGFKILVT